MFNKTTLEQKGFEGFLSFTKLKGGDLSEVPSKPGVYVVVRPEGWKPEFMDHNPGGKFKGRDPTVDRSKLAEKWVDEATVLYIGKTDGTLIARISKFAKFGTGKPVAHWGGRYIWQLGDSQSLLIAWRSADEPRELEKKMIQSFKVTYGKRPFANLVG